MIRRRFAVTTADLADKRGAAKKSFADLMAITGFDTTASSSSSKFAGRPWRSQMEFEEELSEFEDEVPDDGSSTQQSQGASESATVPPINGYAS